MRVVVGYDGSDSAKRALERAAALTGPEGQVVVVASAEMHARPVLTEGATLDPSEISRRRHDADEAKSFLAEGSKATWSLARAIRRRSSVTSRRTGVPT
jgi:nucleotide-binding universal stress UspA family protein